MRGAFEISTNTKLDEIHILNNIKEATTAEKHDRNCFREPSDL